MDSIHKPMGEQRLLFLAFLIIGIYLSPLFILGENAHIRVHDNLDSNLAWYKVLVNSGELFGALNSTIPQIINGLPRNAFGTEWSGIVWLHALFPTMIAYALSQTITRVVAFIGMYLLLKSHFVKEKEYSIIRVGAALAFALTPFWPSGMLSTLGMPLALWAFLNIRNYDRSWRNFLVLTLLPLYSSFVLGFFFFLTAIGIVWLLDLCRGKGWNPRFFFSIFYMIFLYLLVEYRLVYSTFFTTEPNSRDAAERNYIRRVYRAADGLRETQVTSVTVSPRGNVWARHGELGVLSYFDGYSICIVHHY